MSQSYPSDLTDEQWELLSGLIPRAKVGRRPRSVDMQAVVNGILYILCAGCGWRMLPHDATRMENGLSLFSAMAY